MSESSQENQKSHTHTASENNQAKNLHRSATNRMVGGVAGGIGEYFAIDPTVVRLAFVLLVFANGAGLLLYVVMWLIMPEGDQDPRRTQEQLRVNAEEIRSTVKHHAQKLQSDEANGWWGWLLVAIGIFFIVRNFGFFDVFDVVRFWPLLLIGLGLIFLLRGK